jgi:hypothetical protein
MLSWNDGFPFSPSRMVSHMGLQEVIKFLQGTLECSVYVAPREPGLTPEEIYEAGKRAGFQSGEIGDALPSVATMTFGGHKRLLPNPPTMTWWGMFHTHEEPDYRNLTAFDFIHSELNASVRAEGARNAKLERSLIVERAVAQGIPQNDIEVAITILVLSGQLTEKSNLIFFAGQGAGGRQLPSEQLNQVHRGHLIRNDARARAYPIVTDVIERRTDGRPKYTEPLDAFAEELDKLGYGQFRLWWKQTVAELRRGDTQSSPVSVSVLAAALVEGVLTFVVKHARGLDLGVLGSKSFEDNPRTWRIDTLISSAAAGGDSAIFDASTRQRAEALIRIRQRIHAGRMLSDFPSGVPDLRPDEARDARATAELVVRSVLDWLQKYPPSGISPPMS